MKKEPCKYVASRAGRRKFPPSCPGIRHFFKRKVQHENTLCYLYISGRKMRLIRAKITRINMQQLYRATVSQDNRENIKELCKDQL
jgi:hypothetical protein